jgi:hypothetical protein
MPYRDVAAWQNLEDNRVSADNQSQRLGMAMQEYQQRQADRANLEEGLTKFANARDDQERQEIIRKYPQILGNSAGRALDRQVDPGDVTESEYGKALVESRYLGKIPAYRLTPEQKARLAQLEEKMSIYDQKRATQLGIQPPAAPAATPVPSTIKEGTTATNKKTGQKMVFRNGNWVPQ